MRHVSRRDRLKLPPSAAGVVTQFSHRLRHLEVLGFVLLCIGALGMVLLSALPKSEGTPGQSLLYDSSAPPPPSNALIVRSASANLRFFYQYSVIPGGVQSADELREAIADDPVVAAHYSDFGLKHVSFVTLGRDQPFYVSYRLPSGVFWTSRPMLLRRGEKLVTDGFNLARVRCGNRLSEVPLWPVSPVQPAPEEMNVAGVVRAPQGVTHTAFLLHGGVPPIIPLAPIIPFFFPPGGATPPFYASAPLPAPNKLVIILMCSLILLLRMALRKKQSTVPPQE
jgi:hypothetical protein